MAGRHKAICDGVECFVKVIGNKSTAMMIDKHILDSLSEQAKVLPRVRMDLDLRMGRRISRSGC